MAKIPVYPLLFYDGKWARWDRSRIEIREWHKPSVKWWELDRRALFRLQVNGEFVGVYGTCASRVDAKPRSLKARTVWENGERVTKSIFLFKVLCLHEKADE